MDRETIIGGAWANAAQPHTHTQWLDACCRKSHHSKLNLGPPPLKKRTTAHSDVVYGRKEYGSHPGWTLAVGYTPVCSWCHDFDLRTCLMFTVLQKKKKKNSTEWLEFSFHCFHHVFPGTMFPLEQIQAIKLYKYICNIHMLFTQGWLVW